VNACRSSRESTTPRYAECLCQKKHWGSSETKVYYCSLIALEENCGVHLFFIKRPHASSEYGTARLGSENAMSGDGFLSSDKARKVKGTMIPLIITHSLFFIPLRS